MFKRNLLVTQIQKSNINTQFKIFKKERKQKTMAKTFTSTHELTAVEKIKLKNIDAFSIAELTKNSENGFCIGNVKSITIITDTEKAEKIKNAGSDSKEVAEIAIFETENADGETEYYLASSGVVIDTISDIIADVADDESILQEFVFCFSYGVSKNGNSYLAVKVK